MTDELSNHDGDDILRRARRDRAAMGVLYDRHYPGLFRFCLHRLFVRETAEDVASSVFLAIAGGIRDFPGDTEVDFCNWMYRIASNQVNAHIRQRKRRDALLAAAVSERRIRLAESTESIGDPDWSDLYLAIATLSRREQTIVTLRSFEQLSFDRIGAIVEIKPATARVVFHRALKKLKTRLADVMACD